MKSYYYVSIKICYILVWYAADASEADASEASDHMETRTAAVNAR